MDFDNGKLLPKGNTMIQAETEDSKAGSLEHTLSEMNKYVVLEKPWYTKLIHNLASPFSYESGFYYKGKKTYHVKACSIFTLIGIIFLLSSTVVLFEPVLSGRVIYSDLES